MKMIFATGNEGKMKEIRMIMADSGIEVISLKEACIDADVEENGSTFAENAQIKAAAAAKASGLPALADDSGLVIDFLGGEPGIYSARYLGRDTSYEKKNQIIIDRLEGVPDEQRTARFACAIACVFPDGRVLHTEGTMEGIIGYKAEGENGFGYDPILYLPQYGCSSAQLSPEEKNQISHRGKALRLMRDLLKKEMGEINA